MTDAPMRYREYAPSATLAPYVECFWSARSGVRGPNASREILLPDGTTQLLLSFGGAYRRFADAETERGARVAGSHVVGLRSTGVFIEQEGGEDVFAVRFRAGGLYPFLRLPMSECVDRRLGLDVVLGAFADELEARVFEASTPDERVRITEGTLLRRLRAVEERGAGWERVRHAVRQIYASRGTISIDRLGTELGLGYRALDRAFGERVGIPPKRLCRIVRFSHVLSLLQSRRHASASWVAQEAGYADQAHMIRDFRAFTHTTPLEFLARRYGIVELSHPALQKRLSNSFNPAR